jgi:hypothetical protein
MHEIGRLRELTFRDAGGGTGKETDIDNFDTDYPYKQLIVWDPDAQEIFGGYRYIICAKRLLMKTGKVQMATSKLFHLSEKICRRASSAHYWNWDARLFNLLTSRAKQEQKRCLRSIIFGTDLGALTVDHSEINIFSEK